MHCAPQGRYRDIIALNLQKQCHGFSTPCLRLHVFELQDALPRLVSAQKPPAQIHQ
jgi:hypothetical protein